MATWSCMMKDMKVEKFSGLLTPGKKVLLLIDSLSKKIITLFFMMLITKLLGHQILMVLEKMEFLIYKMMETQLCTTEVENLSGALELIMDRNQQKVLKVKDYTENPENEYLVFITSDIILSNIRKLNWHKKFLIKLKFSVFSIILNFYYLYF